MNALKRGGAKLIVAGCLAQRYAEELFDDLPEADCFVGVNEYEKLPEILKGLSADGRRAVFAGACGADTLARASRRFPRARILPHLRSPRDATTAARTV